MTKLMRSVVGGLVVAALVSMGAALAQERDLAIQAFAGQWQGSAISESTVSIHFGLTVRDLDVNIRPVGGGFEIDWTTILRQKGDPESPTVVRKSNRRMRFAPTAVPSVFRGADSSDPLAGGPYAWAAIRGHTLSINVLTIAADGALTMQIYDRTLSPLGMALSFRRLVDGAIERTVDGKLVKIAE